MAPMFTKNLELSFLEFFLQNNYKGVKCVDVWWCLHRNAWSLSLKRTRCLGSVELVLEKRL